MIQTMIESFLTENAYAIGVFFAFLVLALIYVRANKTALLILHMDDNHHPKQSSAVTDVITTISRVNNLINLFTQKDRLVIYARESYEAKFHANLLIVNTNNFITKGAVESTNPSYFRNDAQIQGVKLFRFLKMSRVKTLYVCGLRADDCFEKTVTDAIVFADRKVVLITEFMKLTQEELRVITRLMELGAKLGKPLPKQ